MTAIFLSQAIDSKNYSLAKEILTQKGFFFSLNSQHLSMIKQKIFSYKEDLPSDIKLILISCLLINKVQIQEKENDKLIKYLQKEIQKQPYQEVAAALILRTNFKEFEKIKTYLHPLIVPYHLILNKIPKIKLSNTEIFKNRNQWIHLFNGTELSFERIQYILKELKKPDLSERGYRLIRQFDNEIKFIIERIKNVPSQNINIQRFCRVIDSCLQNQIGTYHELKFVEEKLKARAYELLNQLLIKVEKIFLRKYSWFIHIVINSINDFCCADNLIAALNLFNTVQKIFGNGAFNIEELLFESRNSLIQMLENLLMSKCCKVQIKSAFSRLIEQTKQKELIQVIICCCLKIMLVYFQEPHDDKYFELLQQIINNNKLNYDAQIIYNKIKSVKPPKTLVYSENTQQTYEQIIMEKEGTIRSQNYSTIKKKRKLDQATPINKYQDKYEIQNFIIPTVSDPFVQNHNHISQKQRFGVNQPIPIEVQDQDLTTNEFKKIQTSESSLFQSYYRVQQKSDMKNDIFQSYYQQPQPIVPNSKQMTNQNNLNSINVAIFKKPKNKSSKTPQPIQID